MALLRGARLPAAVAKILDENQWSWSVTGVHQGGGLDCSLLIVKTEGRLPSSASDVTFELDLAATLRARGTTKRLQPFIPRPVHRPNPRPNPNPP